MSALIIMTSSFCQPPLDQKPTITIRPSIPFNFLSNDWYQHNTVTQTRCVSKPFFLALLSSSSSWHFSILRLKKKKKNFSQEETNLSFRSSAEADRLPQSLIDHHIADQAIIGHHTSYNISASHPSLRLSEVVAHPLIVVLRSSSAG